jgi:hypothetical protein
MVTFVFEAGAHETMIVYVQSWVMRVFIVFWLPSNS